MSDHLSLSDFEARYRADPDPWGYETSPYEAAKYAATLDACGDGPFAAGLELGASIGVLTAELAPRCRRLITLDGAPSAVDAARRRLADQPHVDVRLATIPDDLPDGPHDLVLLSEILYYLPEDALARTLERLGETTAPGGRVVAVHWRPAGPERPFTAAEVHRRLRELPWLEPIDDRATDAYRLDVFRRR